MNMIKWILITATAVVLILGLVSILYITDANAFNPGYPAMRGMMNGGGPNSSTFDAARGSNFMMQGARRGMAQGPGFQGAGFVDEDGDGVCDNYGQGGRMGRGPGFVDEDGDGVCDNCGQGGRMGRGFVDEDGDGVCDNCGQGRGTGRGPGFVDEDGDGVCDHYQQNQPSQN